MRIFIKKNIELQVEDMDELFELFSQALGHRKVPFLIVFDDYAHISPDARKMIANENRSHYKMMEAVVVKSLSQRLLINFVIHYHTTLHETKIFNSEDQAKAWIAAAESQIDNRSAISA